MNGILNHLTMTLAQGDGNMMIILVGVLLALFAFSLIAGRGQRKERQAREQMLENLARNDRVVTRSGIVGVINEVKDDEIVVKVDESTNTKVRMKKWAVVGLVSKDKDQQAGEPAEEK